MKTFGSSVDFQAVLVNESSGYANVKEISVFQMVVTLGIRRVDGRWINFDDDAGGFWVLFIKRDRARNSIKAAIGIRKTHVADGKLAAALRVIDRKFSCRDRRRNANRSSKSHRQGGRRENERIKASKKMSAPLKGVAGE